MAHFIRLTLFLLFYRLARVYLSAARSFGTSLCAMGAFDAEFAQAKERLNALKEDPGNEVKLKIYALFKQVRPGSCEKQPCLLGFGIGEKQASLYNLRLGT